MKRLMLITLILVKVLLAGVLHGNYTQHERMEGLSLKEAYMAQYPETLPIDTRMQVVNAPF